MSASTPQDQILGIPPSCSMSCVRTLLTVVMLLTLDLRNWHLRKK